MIVLEDVYNQNLYINENTLLEGVAVKNVYVAPDTTLLINGVVEETIYLEQNSYCEILGSINNLVYGNGTFDEDGIIKGEIKKT